MQSARSRGCLRIAECSTFCHPDDNALLSFFRRARYRQAIFLGPVGRKFSIRARLLCELASQNWIGLLRRQSLELQCMLQIFSEHFHRFLFVKRQSPLTGSTHYWEVRRNLVPSSLGDILNEVAPLLEERFNVTKTKIHLRFYFGRECLHVFAIFYDSTILHTRLTEFGATLAERCGAPRLFGIQLMATIMIKRSCN